MRLLLALLALIAAAGVAVAGVARAQGVDPLAPARAGQAQCYTPDLAAKRCRAMASYAFAADGSILNTAVVLLQPSPPTIMTVTSLVIVRDGAVCGPLRAEDIDAASYTIGAAAATAEQTTTIRAAVRNFMAPMIGSESCATYAQHDEVIAVANHLGGQTIADTMIWVRPDDGYSVRAP